MKLYFKYLYAFILSMSALMANAQQITEQEAKQIASSFFATSSARRRIPSANELKLAYISESQGKKHYYVFNNGINNSGFVIVGGDKVANSILGYSENGTFDYANMPDNVKWWLSQYDIQIATAIEQQSTALQKVEKTGTAFTDELSSQKFLRKAAPRKNDVEDLVKTKWNQSYPYNSQLPSLGNGYSPFVTGCVATAMAQVMNYHKWPQDHGYGCKSYDKKYDPIGTVTFSADFDNSTYDWGNMLNTYPTKAESLDSASPEAVAVGTLMYHAGVSVNMNYGQKESGAKDHAVATALVTNFGYDKGILFRQRAYYSNEEWEELVYNELQAHRPLVYGGQSTSGGHCFICHGYQSDLNLYAFNWGWGGYCDGYYALTGAYALKPNGSGIGGAGEDAAYTNGQDAIFGIQPDKGNATEIVVNCFDTYELHETYNGTNTKVVTYDYSAGGDLYFKCRPQNFTNIKASYDYGVLLRETATGKTYYKHLTSVTNQGPLVGTQYEHSFCPKDMGARFNGTYEVYPVYSIPGEPYDWKIMRQTGSTIPQIIIANAEDDEKVDVAFDISDLDIQVARTASISHNKAYTGSITYTSSDESIAIVSNDGIVTGVSEGTATITATPESNSQFTANPTSFDIVVSSTIKDDVTFSLAVKEFNINDSESIRYSSEYEEEVTYRSSNESVATVSAEGVITAINSGLATITAISKGNAIFKKSMQLFPIKVKTAVTPGNEYEMTDIPVAGCANFISPSCCDIPINWKNNTGEDIEANQSYIRAKVLTGGGWFSNGSYYTSSRKAGTSGTMTIHLSKDYVEKNLTPGRTYTIEFYHDSEFNQPFNIPSITVTRVDDITIDFTMTAAKYGTLCLPFDSQVPEGLKAYECTTYDSDGIAQLTRSMTIKRNTPYIMRGTPGTYSFTGPNASAGFATASNGMLLGVLANNYKLTEDLYILQNHSGKIGFYNVGNGSRNGTDAKQYSSLLLIPTLFDEIYTSLPDGIFLPSFIDDDDDEPSETAITEIGEIQETAIYSLSGIRLSAPQKGISIIRTTDGKFKKVMKQ